MFWAVLSAEVLGVMARLLTCLTASPAPSVCILDFITLYAL